MAVRLNTQKPYDASSAIFTMPKKFVTVMSLQAAGASRPLTDGLPPRGNVDFRDGGR